MVGGVGPALFEENLQRPAVCWISRTIPAGRCGEEIEEQVGHDGQPVQSSLWTGTATATGRTDQKLVSPGLASRIINVGTWITP